MYGANEALTPGMLRSVIIGAILWLLAIAAFAADQRFEIDPPTNADGTMLSDLVGVWLYWAPQRLSWQDDGHGSVTWGEVHTVGPTNRLWLPLGTYTALVSTASGPYAVWAIAVASYGAESAPAQTNCRIGNVLSVRTRKASP